MKVELSARDRARLRAETLCAEDTIRRWARGDSVRQASAERLLEAAHKLHIRTADIKRPSRGAA